MYSDEAVPSIVTMMRVNGTEDMFKGRSELIKKEAGRKIIAHQDFCHSCMDYDCAMDKKQHLFECSSCPRSFHPLCLGYSHSSEFTTLSGQFRCPEHRCMVCDKPGSYVGGTETR
jgi:hypothetical protein